MEKEFIPYDRAFRLKKLGFDEPCFGYYDGNHNFSYMFKGKPEDFSDKKFPLGHSVGWTSAPTFSQAFRFFRDKGYDVSFRKYDYGDESVFTGYYYTIYIGNETIDLHGADKRSKTYEGCELACLDKLLEIVESKQKEDGK